MLVAAELERWEQGGMDSTPPLSSFSDPKYTLNKKPEQKKFTDPENKSK